jgi:hypothetical protein
LWRRRAVIRLTQGGQTCRPACNGGISMWRVRQSNPTGNSLPIVGKIVSSVKFTGIENISLLQKFELGYIDAIPSYPVGASAVVTTRGGLRWTLEAATDARGQRRTAKTCGPDAPDVGVDGGNSTWLTGESAL